MCGEGQDAAGYCPELDYVAARLDRAAEQVAAFGSRWEDYLDSRPHRLTTTVDEHGQGELRLVRTQPIPSALGLGLGEFLYQLRAALDNCLYAVAIIDSGASPPPGGERLQWPICPTPAEWKSNARRYEHLSAELRDALENIQPYRAERPAWNCLQILHDLARVDRHRALPVVALFTSQAQIRVDRRLVTDVELVTGIVHDSGVLVRFTYSGPEPIGPEHIDGDFEFQVELADVTTSEGPAGGIPSRPWGSLANRLRALHKAVDQYTDGLTRIAIGLRSDRQN